MKRKFNERVSRILVCLLLLTLVLPGFTHAQELFAETINETDEKRTIETNEEEKGNIVIEGSSVAECEESNIATQDKENSRDKSREGKLLEIVSEGKSNFIICIPDNPTKVEESAANELKDYIKKATGVELKIVKEKNSSAYALMIGATEFAKENNVIPEGEEDWIIKGFKHKLVLTGGKTRGVLYSVYHFLEDIVGIRWWNPWEEYVPETDEIIVEESFESNGTPSFVYREIYDGLYDVGGDGDGVYPDVEEPSLFYVRNRMNGHFSMTPAEYGGTFAYGPPYHVHSYSHYFPADKYFVDHPEWYSYSIDAGKRIPNGQLCLTNEELLNEFITKVKNSIKISYADADAKGKPRPVMFSIT